MEKGCLAVLVFGVPTPLIMIMITKRTKIEHLITMVITKYLGASRVLVLGVLTTVIIIMITKRTKIEHLITMVITKFLGASLVLVLGVPTPPSWELTQALSTVGSAR